MAELSTDLFTTESLRFSFCYYLSETAIIDYKICYTNGTIGFFGYSYCFGGLFPSSSEREQLYSL
jgi:hypothetical protein